MSPSLETLSKKRPAALDQEPETDDSQPPTKKIKETPNSSPTITTNITPRFRFVQLSLLKSLYEHDNIDDGDVDEETWQSIRRFLEGRNLLPPLIEEVQELDQMHSTLMDLYEQSCHQGSQLSQERPPTEALMRTVSTHGVTSFAQDLEDSPSSDNPTRNPNDSPYALLGGILRMKQYAMGKELLRVVEPFLQLRECVRERMNRLEGLRSQLEDLKNDYKISTLGGERRWEEREEVLARVDCKEGLWKDLWHDLQAIPQE